MSKQMADENGNVYCQKKPFYKKWWFWLLIIIVTVIVSVLGDEKTGKSPSIHTSTKFRAKNKSKPK